MIKNEVMESNIYMKIKIKINKFSKDYFNLTYLWVNFIKKIVLEIC